MEAPRLREFFEVLDTDAGGARPPRRRRSRPACAAWSRFDDVTLLLRRQARRRSSDLSFTALPGETIALVGPTGAGKSTALALLHRAVRSAVRRRSKIDGMDIRGITLTGGCAGTSAWCSRRRCCSTARSPTISASASRTPPRPRCATPAARAQALDFIDRKPRGFDASVGERGRMLSGGERQRLSIAARAAEGPADPDPGRGHQRARRRRPRPRCRRRSIDVMKGPHHLRDRAPASPPYATPPRILVFENWPHHRKQDLRRTGEGRRSRSSCWRARNSRSARAYPCNGDRSVANGAWARPWSRAVPFSANVKVGLFRTSARGLWR